MSARMNEIGLPWVYERVWEDGYGARGWKLGGAVSDPEIIASTPASGERIPTSVFVHDMLDHALCGLGASGHRNEAVALIQLASRTGSDPAVDYAQMVDEDLLNGVVSGEPFRSFLPGDLETLLPPAMRNGRKIVACLEAQLGRDRLRKRLISHFFELGMAGADNARRRYLSHGLDYQRRGPLGLALQGLLEQADELVQRHDWVRSRGEVLISNERCIFEIHEPSLWSVFKDY